VKVCGVPQFDLYADSSTLIPKEDFMNIIGADPHKKLITYTTGAPNVNADPDIVEVVHETMQEGRFSQPCQLLIRLHPRRDESEFAKFKGKEGVILQRPGSASKAFSGSGYFWVSGMSDYKLLANTLAHSDVIINVSSTITIEACILNKPVIKTLPRIRSKIPRLYAL